MRGPRFAAHDLRRALARYVPRRRASSGLRASAVLVPIVLSRDEPEVLFIVRPTTLVAHAGQVAFPGGQIDPSDADPTEAALRETEEELGIPRAHPEVLGQLDEIETHTGFHVTPIVALLAEPLTLNPAASEVSSVFQVPLAELADPSGRRVLRGLRHPASAAPGSEPRLHFWVYTPRTIWGVTGQILANLLTVLATR